VRSFVFHTVGCKVNQYETQAVASLLCRRGLRHADDGAPADLLVVNTCCVTARAAAKCRQAVRRAVKRHPLADVLILGCHATRDGGALRQAALDAGCGGRVHVAGHDDDVAACVEACAASSGEADAADAGPEPRGRKTDGPSRATAGPGRGVGRRDTQAPSPTGRARNEVSMRATPSYAPAGEDPSAACISDSMSTHGAAPVKANIGTAGLPPLSRFAGHQRAFVKVQDGCDAFCTYCIVPHVRPRLWWRPAGGIVAEVAALVAAGHKEVVLCGVNLGAYGRATAVPNRWTAPSPLPALLRDVAAVAGLWRVRLSSLHVADVTDELLAACAEAPAVAPHLHLPLQSGSTPILRRMGRRHTADEFLDAVGRVRRALPEPAITTDVIVGFPGESDDDSAATLAVAGEARFGKIHVFAFSPREGTPAWPWRREAPPPDVVRRRCRRLADLERRSAAACRRRFVGRTVEVLVERANTRTPPGCAHGLTDRYLDVTFPAPDPAALAGRVVRVDVTAPTTRGLTGRLSTP